MCEQPTWESMKKWDWLTGEEQDVVIDTYCMTFETWEIRNGRFWSDNEGRVFLSDCHPVPQ